MVEIIPNWHPVFVHFTVALLSVSVAVHIVTALMKPAPLRDELAVLARWNLWLGAGFAIATAVFGLLAFNTVKHDTPSHIAMSEHRNWAIATLSIFLPLAVWSFQRYRKGLEVNRTFRVLLVVGFALLASTAWHGAEVVFRHGIGVKSLPKADERSQSGDDGHTHEHGAVVEVPSTPATPDESAPHVHEDEKIHRH
jgi:uncharacterized membrane protein